MAARCTSWPPFRRTTSGSTKGKPFPTRSRQTEGRQTDRELKVNPILLVNSLQSVLARREQPLTPESHGHFVELDAEEFAEVF